MKVNRGRGKAFALLLPSHSHPFPSRSPLYMGRSRRVMDWFADSNAYIYFFTPTSSLIHPLYESQGFTFNSLSPFLRLTLYFFALYSDGVMSANTTVFYIEPCCKPGSCAVDDDLWILVFFVYWRRGCYAPAGQTQKTNKTRRWLSNVITQPTWSEGNPFFFQLFVPATLQIQILFALPLDYR